jgi:hypothetical protein
MRIEDTPWCEESGRKEHTVFWMRWTDMDVKSYQDKFPWKVLEAAEKLKKWKYLQSCIDQRHH